jgi:hypothetical protein
MTLFTLAIVSPVKQPWIDKGLSKDYTCLEASSFVRDVCSMWVITGKITERKSGGPVSVRSSHYQLVSEFIFNFAHC